MKRSFRRARLAALVRDVRREAVAVRHVPAGPLVGLRRERDGEAPVLSERTLAGRDDLGTGRARAAPPAPPPRVLRLARDAPDDAPVRHGQAEVVMGPAPERREPV